MVDATAAAPPEVVASVPSNEPPAGYLAAFRGMLLARTLEERIASLYRAGKISGGVFLGTGQEALSVSLGGALREGDYFGPLIRDMAGRLAFGETLVDVTRTYLGSPLGPMRARDGNIHRGRPKQGIFPMISHLGTMVSVIAGALLARRLRGTLVDVVGATSIGDGGTSTGAFHEGMNLAAVERLPMVVLVANNQYAYSTPTDRQFACADLLDRAAGYGFAGHSVDGTDLASCLSVVQSAVAAARAGNGPQMIVARLLRLTGHGEHDDASYVDPTLRASAVGGDCLKLARQLIVSRGWAEAGDLDAWRAKCVAQVDAAVATAQSDAPPDPKREDWTALSTRHFNRLDSEA
jgi:pyruvate dehydrogenase E1 component alpha subunit/2-oxoisovalerate dehydrogenase E1 component alpha subunit